MSLQQLSKLRRKIVNAYSPGKTGGGNKRRFQKFLVIGSHLIISVPRKVIEDLIKFG